MKIDFLHLEMKLRKMETLEEQPAQVRDMMLQSLQFLLMMMLLDNLLSPQLPVLLLQPTTRMHEEGEDDVDIEEHQSKRLKPEDPKRARIQRIAAEYSAKINSVQFGEK